MVTFLTLTRQFFHHTTPIDVINSWGISKMYATQIVKNVNGEELVRDHQMVCLARQVGTLGPSLGHSGTKPWASTDQATGTRCPCDGHIAPKH